MALCPFRVKPSSSTTRSPLKRRRFSALLRRLKHAWYRGQIGHRSEYSVERLLAFRDYYARTSLSRAIAVCVLTPVPAIVVAILIDCIPLRDPDEGWQANYMFWVRMFLDVFVIGAGVAEQVRAVIVAGSITNVGVAVIGLASSVTYVFMSIAIAATWHFPIPFGFILLVAPFISTFWVFTGLVVGPRLIASSPVLRGQLKSQVLIVFTQGVVSMAYPLFTAVFHRLSGVQQTAFVAVMPMIKFATKQIIANAAQGLHEHMGSIVVFSVDVFNVFYVVICMQLSKSLLTTLFMIALDGFHVVVAVRTILHKVNAVKPEDREGLEMDYFRDLPQIVRKMFLEEARFRTRVCRVRVFAPFPLDLSHESVALVNTMSRSRRETHVYASSRVHTMTSVRMESRRSVTVEPVPATQGFRRQSNFDAVHEAEGRLAGVEKVTSTVRAATRPGVIPISSQLTMSSASRGSPPHLVRKGSASRRLLTLLSADMKVSSSTLRAVLSHSAAEEAVWDALQALFHSEYLLMAEYVECALPMLYTAYLSVLFHLPVAPYYPQTASLTSERLVNSVINTLIFTTVEFVGFLSLLILLRRKFGFSPLYQLAFVLETDVHTLQGHLFVWVIFILRLPLRHYGRKSFFVRTKCCACTLI